MCVFVYVQFVVVVVVRAAKCDLWGKGADMVAGEKVTIIRIKKLVIKFVMQLIILGTEMLLTALLLTDQ